MAAEPVRELLATDRGAWIVPQLCRDRVVHAARAHEEKPAAGPVVSGHRDNQVMLIGQAPGLVEEARRVPFQGRSGKLLMRWLARAGYPDKSTARRHVYMTAITKCFPGKGAGSSGDRRPSRAGVALRRPLLGRAVALLRPAVIVLVGGLATERFLPGRP